MAGKSFAFEVNRTSSAPASTLFGLVADGSRWSEWAGPLIPSSSWARRGALEDAGVGAVRKLGVGPLGVKEETTAYEQDAVGGYRHAYKLLGLAPISGYHAEVRFAPTADGRTEISWRGEFTERVPGTGRIFEKALGSVIGQLATRLTSYAER
ncbi:SRPBCC family protein [Nocardioides speluncae]|uniref:SRPBCC family protein n=1 Tax=Nocardioides speluncae TaxID=2670337 RepID=UPI000D69B6D9|nr:SRPBCC family protein [Nocardioides speluncae]